MTGPLRFLVFLFQVGSGSLIACAIVWVGWRVLPFCLSEPEDDGLPYFERRVRINRPFEPDNFATRGAAVLAFVVFLLLAIAWLAAIYRWGFSW